MTSRPARPDQNGARNEDRDQVQHEGREGSVDSGVDSGVDVPTDEAMDGPADGLARGDPGYRLLLVALFAAGVVTFAQLYAPQSLLPLIQAEPGWTVSTARASLTVSTATLGLAATVLAWAGLARRFGTFTTIAASVVLTTVLGLAAALAPSFGMLIGARALQGAAAAGMAALAVAYIVERVRSREVPVVAATYVSGTTIGGVTGRLVAGTVGDALGWRGALLVVLTMSVLFAALFAWAGRRSRSSACTADTNERGRHRARRVLNRRPVLGLYVLIFVLMGSQVAMFNYLGFHLTSEPYRLTTGHVGLFYLSYLGGTVSSRLAGSAAVRTGRGRTLGLAVVAMTAGALGTLADSLVAVALGVAVFCAAFFAAHAVISGWIGQLVDADCVRLASAFYALFYYAGSAVLGWAFGFAYQGPGWPLLIAAICASCVLAGTLAWMLLRHTGTSGTSGAG